MLKENMPIGIFDSGVGGVSVLRELVRLMPDENYIYLGDSKNAPYGTKSHEEIFHHAQSCARYLADKPVKALVVACNTATSVCIEALREEYPHMNVVGIEPALKPAMEENDRPVTAVMATPLTLKEDKFRRLFKEYESKGTVIPLPCPGLMELVEKGLGDSRECYDYLKRLFENIEPPDAIVLGCTHYPFVKENLRRLLPDVKIYDGGEGTAKQVKRLLLLDKLLNTSGKKGSVVFENTLFDENINSLARELLNK